MYSVYIYKYYNSSGAFVEGPTLVFNIPTNSVEGIPFNSPVVRSAQSAADSFDFSMNPKSPYYNSLVQMKTLFRVDYDGTTIFFGRVLTENKQGIMQNKVVHCEGAMGFLNDSYYEGRNEDHIQEISISSYLDKLFDNHNNYMGNSYSWKKIYRGNIGFTATSESRKFEPTSWTDTMSCFTDLTHDYGGQMRVRYENEHNYLDWYRYYARDLGNNRPSIEIGKNLLDFSNSAEVDNIFTRLIPVGDNDKDGNAIYVNGVIYTDKNGNSHTHSTKDIPVSLMTSLYSDAALDEGFHNHNDYATAESDYTPVYKTQSFSNAQNSSQLWSYAVDFIKNNYYKASSSYSIKAVDMRILNDNASKILIGDVVNVTYPVFGNAESSKETRGLVCKNIQYDLINPENNSYTLGIPNDLLDHEYGRKTEKEKEQPKQTSSKSTKSEGVSTTVAPTKSGGGGGKKNTALTFDQIVWTVKMDTDPNYGGLDKGNSMIANGKMSGTIPCFLRSECPDPSHMQDRWITTTLVGKWSSGGRTCGVGFNSERGIYAFTWNMGVPKEIVYFYSTAKGRTYENTDPNTSEPEIDATTGKQTGNWITNVSNLIAEKAGTFKEKLEVWQKIWGKKDLQIDENAEIGGDTDIGGDASVGDSLGVTNSVGVGIVAGPLNNWSITLNQPLTYTVDGVEYTVAEGTVAAEDFHFTAKYDSLRTYLAVVDVLLADYAKIGTLEAMKAFIDNLQADKAVIEKIRAKKIIAETEFASKSYHLYKTDSSSDSGYSDAYLENCFNDVLISEIAGGKIEFKFSKIGGGDVTKNFNIAATAKYQTDVAAAHNSGGGTAYCSPGDATIDPGGSHTLNVYYENSNGAPVYTGRSYTVKAKNAPSTSHGISVTVDTRSYDTEPSTDYELWATTSFARGKWYKFTAKCTGGGSEKSYRFKI